MCIVVPVHDEEHHLGRALDAIRAAADNLGRNWPHITTTITVVLDSCRDRSAAIAACHAAADPRITAVPVHLRITGASRARGIADALKSASPTCPGSVWIATTDADSTVPHNWLTCQAELADAGADAILGTVEPRPADLAPAVLRRWKELHLLKEDHRHIFGANLGVRASAYLAAGGFPATRSHEDRILVDRLRHQKRAVIATDAHRVLTSGRINARAPDGFGAYLQALTQDLRTREHPPAACPVPDWPPAREFESAQAENARNPFEVSTPTKRGGYK